MDFIDRIREVAARVAKQQEHCLTEEATKNAMVLPFIHALGYDIFNPAEVVPEFTADVENYIVKWCCKLYLIWYTCIHE